ncbi:hypothetical protein Caci_2818 [Catenulispora acidiphila DSM 44928]|uniref:Uncharacterized protein n=1 Tax=Catenulispora acidiphila (strain DSM 44928 / JCM 14897 / NBRC 102108 / NRRL B-24433 / ID139908) TaxID=479433 RepID=C7Q152_CATAD|nr:hypothetical protein [Catenulispora acidiphila]ACU71727.1 hypothetical protein Caci_2818 [Catenulispora acidiphila DSM 44928]
MRHLARRRQQDTDHHEPFARFRRHCIIGLLLAGAAFAAAFFTNMDRRSPGDDSGVLGVEIAAAGVGVVCGTGAIMVGVLTTFTSTRQADELKWAVRLGEDMADVYRLPAARSSGSR